MACCVKEVKARDLGSSKYGLTQLYIRTRKLKCESYRITAPPNLMLDAGFKRAIRTVKTIIPCENCPEEVSKLTLKDKRPFFRRPRPRSDMPLNRRFICRCDIGISANSSAWNWSRIVGDIFLRLTGSRRFGEDGRSDV